MSALKRVRRKAGMRCEFCPLMMMDRLWKTQDSEISEEDSEGHDPATEKCPAFDTL